jgi:hypothetical protein
LGCTFSMTFMICFERHGTIPNHSPGTNHSHQLLNSILFSWRDFVT